MAELLPCPWCRCEQVFRELIARIGDEPKHFVECDACLSRGPVFETPDAAQNAWNTRAHTPDGWCSQCGRSDVPYLCRTCHDALTPPCPDCAGKGREIVRLALERDQYYDMTRSQDADRAAYETDLASMREEYAIKIAEKDAGMDRMARTCSEQLVDRDARIIALRAVAEAARGALASWDGPVSTIVKEEMDALRAALAVLDGGGE